MKRILILAAMLSILLFAFGTAQAATTQLDNVAGGAGIAYFQASAAGDVTLFNVQNIDQTPIVVHISLYDYNSHHVVDFPVALSGWDNWGAAITGDGVSITVTPVTPCFYAGAGNGCFGSISGPAAAVAGMQRGYVGITITRGDSAWYGGDGNGDPRNDPNLTNTFNRQLDVLLARTAFITPGAAAAYALNSWMLQGFVNIPNIVEAAGTGWDSIADVAVNMFYNCDADTGDTFPGTDDPNGTRIDTWELYLTEFSAWALLSDDTNGGGVGDTFYTAFGSTSVGPSNGSIVAPRQGAYWGRYNETPSAGTTSTLVVVFPMNRTEEGFNPACGLGSRLINGIACDDNETCPSFGIAPTEVAAIGFGPLAGEIPIPSTSGDFRIEAQAPLAGFVVTEGPAFADSYPLVTEGKFVNVADGFLNVFWGSGHAVDVTTTEVIEISFQETHP